MWLGGAARKGATDARWFGVLAMAAALLTSTAAQAGGFAHWRSPRLGLVLDVPAGAHTVRAEPAPASARADQIQESVLLVQGEAVLVRIDLFTGPPIDVQTWFERDGAFVLTPDVRVQHISAGAKKVPALRLSLPGSEQSYPSEMAFVVLGSIRARITWPNTRDVAVKPLFERALQTLDAPPARAPEHRR